MTVYVPRAGDRVRARRYEQPTLKPGDPARVLMAEWTGTANAHNGMVADSGSYVSFDYVFLGASRRDGSLYAVTEVELLTGGRR
jgi:hypothetical protein